MINASCNKISGGHISDPSQLNVGMELWEVGRGGCMTEVSPPHMIGTVVVLDYVLREQGTRLEPKKDFFVINGKGGLDYRSYSDHHILPQTYNDWYLCATAEEAWSIYNILTGN